MTTPFQAPPGPKPDPMGPDPDPAPDPDPIKVPNPNPEPAPLPEEPTHADADPLLADDVDLECTSTSADIDRLRWHEELLDRVGTKEANRSRDRSRRKRSASGLALRIAAAVLGVGGAVIACYNEVPGPQGPLPSPSREVPPQGPKPGPLVPTPHLIPPMDAGLPIPTPQGMTPNAGPSSSVRLTIPVGARYAGTATAPAIPPPGDSGVLSIDHARASNAAPRDTHAPSTSTRIAQKPDTRAASSSGQSSDPPPPTTPQPPAGSDAGGIDSPADLPPDVPDAGTIATADGGTPLGR